MISWNQPIFEIITIHLLKTLNELLENEVQGTLPSS